MKNRFILLGGVILISSLVSCQKNEMPGAGEQQPQMITRTMTVETDGWGDVGSKSSYTDGAVKLSGEENIGVFYHNSAEMVAYNNKHTNDGKKVDVFYFGADAKYTLKATPIGNWSYTFSHAEVEGQDTYDYYFILPYSYSALRPNNGKVYAKLSRVQFPRENSFDPVYDILIGKPVKGIPIEGTVKVEGFKRAFTPLRVNISGLEAGEKIYAATISFNQGYDVVANDRAWKKFIIGNFNLNMSEDYKAAAVSGAQAKYTVGNAVTALYPKTGLATSGNVYPVWYMIHPTTIENGVEMTVSVSTQTKTYTRTVTVPTLELLKEKINSLDFDITGEGYTVHNSVTTDFTTIKLDTKENPASNGETYTWDWNPTNPTSSNDNIDGYSSDKSRNPDIPNAIRLKAGTLTLPVFNRPISEIRVYTHPGSGTSQGKDACRATVSYMKQGASEATTDSYGFDYNSTGLAPVISKIPENGGFVKITLENHDGSAVSITGTNKEGAKFITAITVIFEDETAGE